MPNYLMQEPAEEFLNAISTTQQAVIEAVKTWVDGLKSVAPKVATPALPFADALPKPEEIVNSTYDFAEKLLASQRRFAGDLVKATAPLLPGTDGDTQQAPSFE